VEAAGLAVKRYAYDPFGAATVLDPDWLADADGQSDYGWVHLFQGLRRSAESGLSDARNRWYSPTLGRWITSDPIGYAAGDPNLYAFVGNGPADHTDPSGLQPPLVSVVPPEAGNAFMRLLFGDPAGDYAKYRGKGAGPVESAVVAGGRNLPGARAVMSGLEVVQGRSSSPDVIGTFDERLEPLDYAGRGLLIGLDAAGARQGVKGILGLPSGLGLRRAPLKSGEGLILAAGRRFSRSEGAYRGALDEPFAATGNLDDLTREIQKIHPEFKGFVHKPDILTTLQGHGYWNEKTRQIELAMPLDKASRGVVAEEVRHALDFFEGGLTGKDVYKGFIQEHNLTGITEQMMDEGLPYNWLHRRVYTRMMRDAEQGTHPIMSKLLRKSDVDLLYEMYLFESKGNVWGNKSKDWLLQQPFSGLLHHR
jgi:RHS repeat-associated protein